MEQQSGSVQPIPVDYRAGCRVSWYYYATREEADIASVEAFQQGNRKTALGYDFGYCSPGHVQKTVYKGRDLYEVCFP